MPASGPAPRWASAQFLQCAVAGMQGAAVYMQGHFSVFLGVPAQALMSSTACVKG